MFTYIIAADELHVAPDCGAPLLLHLMQVTEPLDLAAFRTATTQGPTSYSCNSQQPQTLKQQSVNHRLVLMELLCGAGYLLVVLQQELCIIELHKAFCRCVCMPEHGNHRQVWSLWLFEVTLV